LALLYALKPGEQFYSELSDLLKRVYGKQRSTYVHGAVLRHNEDSKQSILNAQPNGTRPYAPELLYQVDLVSISTLARRAILTFMLDEGGGNLDEELFFLRPFKILTDVTLDAQITLPKHTLVGFKKGPMPV
jgi:hypothetical protein